MKVRIVQCLCGPDRHCIVGLAYMPGQTAAQADYGALDDLTFTRENAAAYVEQAVDGMIARKVLNPWCWLCKRPREVWYFEDAETIFRSMEEAEPMLREMQQAQERTRSFLGSSRN